ncbi:hypothetical protein [Nonomuraea sp. NPDC003214]
MARWRPRRAGAPEPGPFVPPDVDEEAARAEITSLVEGLAPGGVDEATGHSLDNLVNAMSARWEQEVQAEYAAYCAEATTRLGVADAAVAGSRPAEEDARERLADARAALDAARSRLSPGGEAGWGARGHADPALMAGRPLGPLLLHAAALAAAVAADWAAFLEVVKLLMRGEGDVVTSAVVVGFTAIVIYLAHAAGCMFRDIRAGSAGVSRPLAVLCVLGWAAFGAAAFLARLTITARRPAFGAEAPPDDGGALMPALFFLAFFVGTGIVAAVGAYLTHNPLRSAYGRAARVHRQALGAAAAAARELALAEAARSAHANQLMAARQRLLHALQVRLALAERLKQLARVLIAQHAQDPAVTDAILEPDLRPYAWQ